MVSPKVSGMVLRAVCTATKQPSLQQQYALVEALSLCTMMTIHTTERRMVDCPDAPKFTKRVCVGVPGPGHGGRRAGAGVVCRTSVLRAEQRIECAGRVTGTRHALGEPLIPRRLAVSDSSKENNHTTTRTTQRTTNKKGKREPTT